MKDFFISYQRNDGSWAEWIAWHLTQKGYEVILQAWDFLPGCNIPHEMNEAIKTTRHTIAILSPDYIEESKYGQAEWKAVFFQDPLGEQRKLIPVKVRAVDLKPEPLLTGIAHINLIGIPEEEAIELLLSGVKGERKIPQTKPDYPLQSSQNICPNPYYPNNKSIDAQEKKYIELVEYEFNNVKERLREPAEKSQSSQLFFGAGFPFGSEKPIPAISKCAVSYDIDQLCDATIGKYHNIGYPFADRCKPQIVYKVASCRWRLLVALVADGLEEFDKDIVLTPLFSGIKSADCENIAEGLKNKVHGWLRHSSQASRRDFTLLPKELLRLIGKLCRQNSVTLEDLLAEEQGKHRQQEFRPLEKFSPNKIRVKFYFRDDPGVYEKLLRSLAEHHINIIRSQSWTLIPDRVACAELHLSHKENSFLLYSELQNICEKYPTREIVFTVEKMPDQQI